MENKLPKNWVETELENIFNLAYGKGLSVKELTEDGYDVYGANGIIGKFTDYSYENSKIIISCRGAASGAIHKTNPKSFITSNSIVLNEISFDLINLDFIKYVMTNVDKSDVITGTAQPQITIQLLKDLKIPLPPLQEQNRIVVKLDKLFNQLDTIKTSMANISILLKDFRKQVLTRAVTGRLTEEWRKGKKLEAWEDLTLSELIVEKPRNGYSPRAVDYETAVKSLSLSATTSGVFDSSHVKYLDIEVPVKNSHLWLMKGDILIQRSNSLDFVGTSAIYDSEDFEFIYPDIMIKIRANDRVITKYLNYCLSSYETREYFRNNATGTAGNMPKINQVVVLNTPINLPSQQEQQEIVLRVESLFAKADIIEQQYKSLKQKIDTLPQGLLHKAFKGELTEQFEIDGDARELLKEIKKIKELKVKDKPIVIKKTSVKTLTSKTKSVTKTNVLKQKEEQPVNNTSFFSLRTAQIKKTNIFQFIQDNYSDKILQFSEIIKSSKLDYDQIWAELQEILELTELGMRPGLEQKYSTTDKGMRFKWIKK